MTLFEKKRFIIKLVREWFPKTPIYFNYHLEDNFGALTQFHYYDGYYSVKHFAFSEYELLLRDKEQLRDITLHEVAHGLNGPQEDSDGHDDRWLKLFYAIGGKNCWCSSWEGYYREY